MRFLEKITNFFRGRYGIDSLFYALGAGYLLLYIAGRVTSSLARNWMGVIVAGALYLLGYGCIIFAFFRVLSRNIVKRRVENEKWKKFWQPISDWFKLQKNIWQDRKTHVYRKCPDKSCKAVLRLPKKPGQHTVRCPKCGKTFEVRI